MMAASERITGGENKFLPVRTRFFDDIIGETLANGVDQVVMLGAGLDTRPFRLNIPPAVTWWEADRAELLDEKEAALATMGAEARCARVGVPVDLAVDRVTPLQDAGLRPDKRTLWVAEGLLFYLTPEQVDGLLRAAAAASAPGSVIAADVMSTTVPTGFGCDDPAALLAAGGWTPSILTWAGGVGANFGRFPDLSALPAGAPRAHLVAGRIVAGTIN
jgi:methyltransferase (TIGR00027 family)